MKNAVVVALLTLSAWGCTLDAEAGPEEHTLEHSSEDASPATAVYRHFGNLVYQYRVGALDRQMWQSYRNTLKKHLCMPSWQAWFEVNKEAFSTSLVELVGRIVRELEAEGQITAPRSER